MKKRNVAVLLIHMQEYFTSGENQGTRKVIPAQIKALKLLNELGVSIFPIEWDLQDSFGLGPTDSEILDSLSGKTLVERINCPTISAYVGTHLEAYFFYHDVKSVIIMGTKTCHCAMLNAKETKKMDKEIIVSFDLMAAECGDCFQCFQEERKCDWFHKNATCFLDYRQLVRYVETKFPEK